MTEYWKQWEGQVIDAFPLRQYLGGDGEHAVFLTEHGQSASKAAIKIVLGTPENLESQLERWSLAAQLAHPNLLRIFSMGRAGSGDARLVYLVMEYADESLSQVIPNRPLSSQEARQMLEPTLSVLEHIHGHGFVHGHVKPGNIMAVGECLKISSAGVCRIGERSPEIPDDYTAPEGAASPVADVWSLGMTLVETLTQHLPVRSPAAEPVVPDTLPPPFFEIARDCLHSDPKRRAALADIAARLRPDFPRPARRPALKWTYALAAVAGLVLAAVVIAPKIIDRQGPVTASQPAQIPPAPPLQPPPKVQASPPAPAVRNEIIQRVLPEVPARASQTIQGRVRVNVLVDVEQSGKVVQTRLESAGASKYFAQLALEAAQRWKFAPANGGDPVPREWILHFEFSRTGTKVVPVRKGS